MSSAFAIRRANGKSDSQVIVELVERGQPGDILSYESLRTSLSEDGHAFDIPKVQASVRRSMGRIGSELQRALVCVPKMGYRIIPASEHRILAKSRKRRSDRQLAKGMSALKNVRWDEMDEQSRLAHEGQLLILGSLYQQQKSFDNRLRKIEEAIQTRQGLS